LNPQEIIEIESMIRLTQRRDLSSLMMLTSYIKSI